MSNPRFVSGLVVRNENGGYYHPGAMYDLPKKLELAEIYIDMYYIGRCFPSSLPESVPALRHV